MKVQITSKEASITIVDDADNTVLTYEIKGLVFNADLLKFGSALQAVMSHFEDIANGITPVTSDAQARARAAEFETAEVL